MPAASPPEAQHPTGQPTGHTPDPATAPPEAEAADAPPPLETEGRHAPPLPRARAESRHSARATAAEAGAGAGAGAGASPSRPGGQPRTLEPDDLLWVVGAGSLYTVLLVAFQSLWIKAHWLSMWN